MEQQTDEQEKGKTTIDDSLFQVQCDTIHGVGSFRGLGLDTGIVPDFHKGAELYFVAQYGKHCFSLPATSRDASSPDCEWNRSVLDHRI